MSSNVMYVHTRIFGKMKKQFGWATSGFFGLLYNFNEANKNSGKDCLVTISQQYIENIIDICPKNQPKYSKILEDWYLIEVHRNYKRNIIGYEINEHNFTAFMENTEKYIEIKNRGLMKKINTNNILSALENLDRQSCRGTPETKSTPTTLSGHSTIQDKQEEDKSSSDNQRLSTTPSPKTALQRREKQKEVNNRQGSVVQRKDEEISPKRKSINDFAYSRNFVRVKKLWNSLPTRKLSDYNPEKQNKTLDRSILAVQALLNGRLLETGITTAENKKVHVKLPDNFNVDDCGKLDIHWLLEKIERFGKIIEDEQLAPRNKDFLRRLSLGDFILGAMTNQGQSESVMFQYCCGEVQTVWEDPHPDITSAICHHFNTWTEKEHDYSGRELRELSKLSEKLVEFAEQKDVKRSRHLGKGNVARLANVFMKTLSIAWGAHFMVINPSTLAKENAWKTFVNNVEY